MRVEVEAGGYDMWVLLRRGEALEELGPRLGRRAPVAGGELVA